MLRERDNSADGAGATTIGPTLGWRSESDGTLEERPTSMGKHCQNWRADVVAIVTSAGIPVEYTRYSAYGEPTVYPAADIDMDGDVDSADETEYYNVKAGGTNGPSAYTDDINFDGYQDNEDEDLLDLSLDWNLGLSGKGRVSSPQVGNRIGYAGYQWDQVIRGNHVRHRVYLPEIGRWTRRDPIGESAGANQYEYVSSAPERFVDPWGLFATDILETLGQPVPDRIIDPYFPNPGTKFPGDPGKTFELPGKQTVPALRRAPGPVGLCVRVGYSFLCIGIAIGNCLPDPPPMQWPRARPDVPRVKPILPNGKDWCESDAAIKRWENIAKWVSSCHVGLCYEGLDQIACERVKILDDCIIGREAEEDFVRLCPKFAHENREKNGSNSARARQSECKRVCRNYLERMRKWGKRPGEM